MRFSIATLVFGAACLGYLLDLPGISEARALSVRVDSAPDPKPYRGSGRRAW